MPQLLNNSFGIQIPIYRASTNAMQKSAWCERELQTTDASSNNTKSNSNSNSNKWQQRVDNPQATLDNNMSNNMKTYQVIWKKEKKDRQTDRQTGGKKCKHSMQSLVVSPSTTLATTVAPAAAATTILLLSLLLLLLLETKHFLVQWLQRLQHPHCPQFSANITNRIRR